MGKYVYSGPNQFTLDTTLMRTFPIHESVSLRLQVNAFNVLNHPNFAQPNTSLGSSSFGQVTATTSEGASMTNTSGRTLQFAGTISF